MLKPSIKLNFLRIGQAFARSAANKAASLIREGFELAEQE